MNIYTMIYLTGGVIHSMRLVSEAAYPLLNIKKKILPVNSTNGNTLREVKGLTSALAKFRNKYRK